MNPKNKRYLIAGLVILIAAAVTAGISYLNYRDTENSYMQAIELIKQADYESAANELKSINEKIDKNFSYYAFNGSNFDDYYKDSAVLYDYAVAMDAYENGGSMSGINQGLESIPDGYSGEMSEQIKRFKADFAIEYEKYKAEQKRQDEERERERRASYANKLPFEGMSEKYIDYTMMGKHDKLIADDDNDDFVYNVYYWNTNSGDTMLAVSCANGEVSHVSKYGIGYFWTADGKPNYNGKNPYKSSGYKSSKKSEDPYDVQDYSDPEDFYYDNYDDFWDYEEAEDYYNSYHD